MKALAIRGSPRKGGNTENLLKKVLEPLEAAGWSTEYLRIGGKPVRGPMLSTPSITMFLISSMIVSGSLCWNLGMGGDKGLAGGTIDKTLLGRHT